MKWVVVVGMACGLTLVSCQPSYEDQVEALVAFVKKRQIGSSGEQWIIKHNAFGQDERVGLIFGFTDDLEFCTEVAELYMKRHPADRYKCRPAN